MRTTTAAERLSVAVLVALLASMSLGMAGLRGGGPLLSVIVREAANAGSGPERAVRDLGGKITRRLSIIDGFAAKVPARSLANLARIDGIQSVTPDGHVRLAGQVDGYDPNWSSPIGSWKRNIEAIKAKEVWKAGFTGQGVDVAVIDSGVAPVEGIRDHLVFGPDLSFDSPADNLRNLDAYGHGTHMAGIIAGRDSTIGTAQEDEQLDKAFLGVAPRHASSASRLPRHPARPTFRRSSRRSIGSCSIATPTA
jgi:serine protease AprX